MGGTILAIPIAFPEEACDLGNDPSWVSVIILSIVSAVFVGLFIDLNSYRKHMTLHDQMDASPRRRWAFFSGESRTGAH